MIYDLIYRQNKELFIFINGCKDEDCAPQRVIKYNPKIKEIRSPIRKWHNVYQGNGSPKHRTTHIFRRKNLKSAIALQKTTNMGIRFKKYSSLFR